MSARVAGGSPRALVLAAVVSMVVAGCGESAGGATKPPSAAAALRKAIERVDGSVAVRLREISAREGRKTETVLDAEGRIDLDRGTGSVEADLDAIVAGLVGLQLSWDRRTVEGLDGAGTSMTRAEARNSAGVIGRLPDMVEALPALARQARRVRSTGPRRWRFFVSAAEAQKRGLLGRGARPKTWPAEARADSTGRLRSIVLVVPLLGVVLDGRVALPAGSETYRLDLG